jgi:hypothetical protein
MPPYDETGEEESDHPRFDIFDKVLEKILGLEVLWNDIKVFFIKKSKRDTADKRKLYSEYFWSK